MANALKIISLVLSYPTRDLLEASAELHQALAADATIGEKEKAWLGALIDDLAVHDIYDAQERYVLLFDRTRTNSLHLFEHVHGESRDRGQAMVDLATMYDAQGFDIDAKELPDYLPLFLEYLSTQSTEEVQNLLGQTLHIITAIRERLQKRTSIYANALLALEGMVDATADTQAVADILKTPEDDPNDLKALDEIWEEEAITFGGNAGENDCGPDRMKRQMRAAKRPPPEPEIMGGQ